MKLTSVGLLLLIYFAQSAGAFSPYESYLMSGKETHVGLIASIEDGGASTLGDAFESIRSQNIGRQLQEAKISDVQAFTRTIECKEYVVVYFRYAGGQPYLDAARAFEKATDTLNWKTIITPHPRAKT